MLASACLAGTAIFIMFATLVSMQTFANHLAKKQTNKNNSQTGTRSQTEGLENVQDHQSYSSFILTETLQYQCKNCMANYQFEDHPCQQVPLGSWIWQNFRAIHLVFVKIFQSGVAD